MWNCPSALMFAMASEDIVDCVELFSRTESVREYMFVSINSCSINGKSYYRTEPVGVSAGRSLLKSLHSIIRSLDSSGNRLHLSVEITVLWNNPKYHFAWPDIDLDEGADEDISRLEQCRKTT